MLKGKVAATITRGLRITAPQADARFVFRHHPDGWVQNKTGELIPVLHRLFEIPGVALVDLAGDMSHAIAAGEALGWRVIEQRHCLASDTPDQQEGYLREWEVFLPRMGDKAKPVKHFTDAWQFPEVVSGSIVWKRDEIGYLKWLQSLVKKGVIAPASADLVATKRIEAERMAATLAAAGNKAAEAESLGVAERAKALGELEEKPEPRAKPAKGA